MSGKSWLPLPWSNMACVRLADCKVVTNDKVGIIIVLGDNLQYQDWLHSEEVGQLTTIETIL